MSFSQQVTSLSALLPISRSCFLLRPGPPCRGCAGAVRGGLCAPCAEGGSRIPPPHHRDVSQGTKATTCRLCMAEVAKLPMAMVRIWSQVPKSPHGWLSLPELAVCTPQHICGHQMRSPEQQQLQSAPADPRQGCPQPMSPAVEGRTVPAPCQGQAELGAGTSLSWGLPAH